MQRTRDKQRIKAYRAEWAMKRKGQVGRHFATAMHVEAYVRRLAQSKWFMAKFGRHYFRLEPAHSTSSSAHPGHVSRQHIIRINSEMRNELTVLHEMAHCVRPIVGEWPREVGAWHGPEFAATFLILVQHQMGAASAKALRAEFTASRAKYKRPRAPMSPEQKAVLAARLAQYRKPLPAAAMPATAITYDGEL